MQITFNRLSFIAAFETVVAVVPRRTTRDILKNIKLVISDGPSQDATVTLMATDGEIGIRYEIEAESIDTDDGDATRAVLLPAVRTMQILQEVTGDSVRFQVDSASGADVSIHSGPTTFRIAADNPDDFPPISTFSVEQSFVIDSGTLTELIRRTNFAADVESMRYALAGIQVEFLGADRGNQVFFTATDSRRLAIAVGKCSGGAAIPPAIPPVIPQGTMALVERALVNAAADAPVQISFTPNGMSVVVRCGRVVITSDLVQGRFPDWRKVVPSNDQFTAKINLPVPSLLSAIRQVQIVTNEENRGIDFTFSAGALKLGCKSYDIGQAMTEIPIEYDGPDVVESFDPRYVVDPLQVLCDESGADASVTLNLIEPGSPAVLSTENYKYLIMPLSRDR